MSLLSYPSFSWRERLIIKTTEDKILNINNIERGKVLHDILSRLLKTLGILKPIADES